MNAHAEWPREVLVRVHASTVTQGDRRLRAADLPGIMGPLGRLMSGVFAPRHPVGGTSFAGSVVAVGAQVSHLQVGDDVFGMAMHGAYAEYLAVPVDAALAKMPANTGYAEAAAIPYGAGTALYFLRDLAKLRGGERVLIMGASGGGRAHGGSDRQALRCPRYRSLFPRCCTGST